MIEREPSRPPTELVGCVPRDLLLAARADGAPRETRERVLATLAANWAAAGVNAASAFPACPGETAGEGVPVSTSSGVFETQLANAARASQPLFTPPAPCASSLASAAWRAPAADIPSGLTSSISRAQRSPARSIEAEGQDFLGASEWLGALRSCHHARALQLAVAVLAGVLVGNGIYRLATKTEREASVAAVIAVPQEAREERPLSTPTRAVTLGAPYTIAGKGKRSLGNAHARAALPCAAPSSPRSSEAVAPRTAPHAGRTLARRGREDWLGEQLALLARAEREFAEDGARAALRSLDEYDARFPDGMLDPQMGSLRERVERSFEAFIFP